MSSVGNTVSEEVRFIQSSLEQLLKHEMRTEIIHQLKLHMIKDSDIEIRYAISNVMVQLARTDYRIVSEWELVEIVKQLMVDKRFIVREKALTTLGIIFIRDNTHTWICQQILNHYHSGDLNDRIFIERLLINVLVDCRLPAKLRMMRYYELFCSIDGRGTNALNSLHENQLKIRNRVSAWVSLISEKEHTSKIQEEIELMCRSISRELPDPIKSQEFLEKFSANLVKNINLMRAINTILRTDVSCTECVENMTLVLEQLGCPIPTNLYYKTIKILLDRISSLLFDRAAIEVLIDLVTDCISDGTTMKNTNLPPASIGKRGLELITALSRLYPNHFQYDTILRKMTFLLRLEEEYIAEYILKAFTSLGRHKPLIKCHAEFLSELAPICKKLAISGTPKQSKHAIRCMFVNTRQSNQFTIPANMDIFPDIMESIKTTLLPEHACYRTAIVALGHIAYNMPDRFTAQIKSMVACRLVKRLLIAEGENIVDNQPLGEWCDEDRLPEKTRCKVEALKTMANWLSRLAYDEPCTAKTFRLLSLCVQQKGDLLQSESLSPAEMSLLRLSAGMAMLKICEQNGVGNQCSAEQFYILSTLMIDPVMEVRELFAKKLHKCLSKGIPHKCLPLDFMGFYALGGRETDRKLQKQIKTYIETDVNCRREYLKTYASAENAMVQLPHILPDYMVVFAVSVLTHDPNFTSLNDPTQLNQIEKCLWIILEPLITKPEFFCFGFYKNLIQRIKNHRDAYKPDDATANHKMYVICDLAMHIIRTKSNNYDVSDFTLDVQIPSMYYQAQPESYQNVLSYIPEMYLSYNETEKTDITMPITRTVSDSDDKGATTPAVSSTSLPSPLNIQDANQSANVNSTNSSANDTEDEQPTDGNEPSVRTRSKQTNQTDENTEPPAKRLRTRAATAASNHQ